MPSGKRHPRSGLAGKRIDPESEAADIFCYNQQSSRLLRLPAELRRIIYDYVLGGDKTIFIQYRRHEWKRRKVPTGSELVHAVKGGFHCSVWSSGYNPYKHSSNLYGIRTPNNERPEKGFTLLSQVCRQLYMETSTLAMSENTWAFENYYVMNRYLTKEKRLSLAQRRAIRVLMVPWEHSVTKTIVRYLGNLEAIIANDNNGPLRVVDPRSIGSK